MAGERGRLQEAIRGGVAWLSHNGSNPDVAAKSTEVSWQFQLSPYI